MPHELLALAGSLEIELLMMDHLRTSQMGARP
jgi:hypothetical protein